MRPPAPGCAPPRQAPAGCAPPRRSMQMESCAAPPKMMMQSKQAAAPQNYFGSGLFSMFAKKAEAAPEEFVQKSAARNRDEG